MQLKKKNRIIAEKVAFSFGVKDKQKMLFNTLENQVS